MASGYWTPKPDYPYSRPNAPVKWLNVTNHPGKPSGWNEVEIWVQVREGDKDPFDSMYYLVIENLVFED